MDTDALQQRLRDFAADRDWGRFHSPKNLVMALSGEVGELTEIFQWLTLDEATGIMQDQESAEHIRHELADVLGYLLRLADVLDVDLESSLLAKLELNETRYPVHLARGSAKKYTEFEKE